MRMEPIRHFPGYYAIEDGNIWSERRETGRILKQQRSTNGTCRVCLMRGGVRHDRRVDRLVLEAFTVPKSRMGPKHKNNVVSDNRLANLAWDKKEYRWWEV